MGKKVMNAGMDEWVGEYRGGEFPTERLRKGKEVVAHEFLCTN